MKEEQDQLHRLKRAINLLDKFVSERHKFIIRKEKEGVSGDSGITMNPSIPYKAILYMMGEEKLDDIIDGFNQTATNILAHKQIEYQKQLSEMKKK